VKPRFSILAILGLTAYVAVAAYALSQQTIASAALQLYAWFAVVLWIGITAFAGSPAARAFAGAFTVACLAYVAIAIVGGRGMSLLDTPDEWMPHIWLRTAIVEKFGLSQRGPVAYHTFYPWTVTNTSLIVGLVGGVLGRWRYRVLEGREKHSLKSPSG
jgi:hypothetical protein